MNRIKLQVLHICFASPDFWQNTKRSTMKKKLLSLGLAFAMVGFVFAHPAAAFSYVYEGVKEETITRGVVNRNYQILMEDGYLVNINMLEADLTDPALTLEVLNDPRGLSYRSSTKNIVASHKGAVAGVNGDFFATQGGDGSRASSIGTIISNGKLLATPSYEEGTASFGIDAGDGSFIMDYFKPNIVLTAPSGATAKVAYVNKYNSLKEISMYTEAFGEYAQDGALFQMAVADGVVTEISRENKGLKIPEGGYVLSVLTDWDSFLLDNFQVGSAVGLQMGLDFYDLSQIKFAIGGGSILVNNGVVPDSFSHDIQQSATARTAVGVNQDGTRVYLITVDNKTSASRGLRLKTLGEFLASKGVYKAINLDGGGSTTMVAKNFATGEVELKNTPSDGSMRYVANALGIVSTASPQDVVAHLTVESKYKQAMTGVPIPLTVTATDEYYYPVSLTGVNQVSYSVTGVEGSVENGVFTARSNGTAHITATAGGVSAFCDIEINNDAAVLHFEPRVLSMQPGDVSKLCFVATMRSGDSFSVPLSRLALTQSAAGIVSIGEEEIKGVTDGTTLLTAKLDNGATAYALVRVGGQAEGEPPADIAGRDSMNRTGQGPLENAALRVNAMAGMKNKLTLFDNVFNQKIASYVNENADVSIFTGAYIDQSIAKETAKKALFAGSATLHTAAGSSFLTLTTTADGVSSVQGMADFTKNLKELAFEKNIFVFANNDPRTLKSAVHKSIVVDALEQKATQGKNVFVIYPGYGTTQTCVENGVHYMTLTQTPSDMNASNFLQKSQSIQYLSIEIAQDGSPTYRYVSPFAK